MCIFRKIAEKKKAHKDSNKRVYRLKDGYVVSESFLEKLQKEIEEVAEELWRRR